MPYLFPDKLVEGLRSFQNVSVEIYGIDCKLYLVGNAEEIDYLDRHGSTYDLVYTPIDTQVWLEWQPTTRRLKTLGIEMQDESPIIAWFKSDLDIKQRSYFTIDLKYIPSKYKTDEFEITDIIIPAMYSSIVLKSYKIAPRKAKG